MKAIKLLLVLLVLCSSAYAKEIKVAVGLALPPYIIQEKNAGMEIDVVAQALADSGHTLKPVYVPMARVPVAMEDGSVDAAMTINEASGIKAAFSDSHITYQNFAISLSKNGYKVEKVEDLGKYSIAAFQNATMYLGDKYKAMAAANKRYNELADQAKQNKMLYTGRADFVVGDRNIFNYYNADVKKEGVDVSQPVTYHDLFPPTPYKVAFRDPAIRDAFNAALKKMRADGRYDAIMKKYQ